MYTLYSWTLVEIEMLERHIPLCNYCHLHNDASVFFLFGLYRH